MIYFNKISFKKGKIHFVYNFITKQCTKIVRS